MDSFHHLIPDRIARWSMELGWPICLENVFGYELFGASITNCYFCNLRVMKSDILSKPDRIMAVSLENSTYSA
jgi:hypothetical protein